MNDGFGGHAVVQWLYDVLFLRSRTKYGLGVQVQTWPSQNDRLGLDGSYSHFAGEHPGAQRALASPASWTGIRAS